MFSRLDPVFKGTLRHTESTDTRQGIRREEQTGGEHKKQDKKEDDKPSFEPGDSTVVSVRALQAFLEGMLAATAPAAAEGRTVDLSPAVKPAATASPEAARAASAYQNTARTGASPSQPPPEQAGKPALDLSVDEIRIMHQLIDDLKFLSSKQVEQLAILYSDSFLQGIVDAAQTEKRKISG